MINKSRLYIPALGGIYGGLWDLVWLLLRLVTGLLFAAHGFWKLGYLGGPGMTGIIGYFDRIGYSPGSFWGPTVATIEIVGGLLLAVGLLTRPAALVAFIEMVLVTYFHTRFGFWHVVQGGGVEYPLMWSLVLLYFVIRGGGAWSVDAKMRKEF